MLEYLHTHQTAHNIYIIYTCMHECSTQSLNIRQLVYTCTCISSEFDFAKCVVCTHVTCICTARKHTGKVEPRTSSRKSPVTKSNGRCFPKTKKSPSRTEKSLSMTNKIMSMDKLSETSKADTTSTKMDNKFPKETKTEAEITAASTQMGDTSMDSSADSASTKDSVEKQGPSTKGEVTPTTEMPVDETPEEEATATKPKVHPFFGRSYIHLHMHVLLCSLHCMHTKCDEVYTHKSHVLCACTLYTPAVLIYSPDPIFCKGMGFGSLRFDLCKKK